MQPAVDDLRDVLVFLRSLAQVAWDMFCGPCFPGSSDCQLVPDKQTPCIMLATEPLSTWSCGQFSVTTAGYSSIANAGRSSCRRARFRRQGPTSLISLTLARRIPKLHTPSQTLARRCSRDAGFHTRWALERSDRSDAAETEVRLSEARILGFNSGLLTFPGIE